MTISIIGTNGLLSNSIGEYSNRYSFRLSAIGRNEPSGILFDKYLKVDLIKDTIDYNELIKSDVIIYTAGAGIQFHLNEDCENIYHLNTFLPVSILNTLKTIGYNGTFISFGSYFEIGENSEDKSFNEIELLNSCLVAPNDYSISKRLLTRFISSFNAQFKFFHFILPTIYGELESPYRLIPYTLNAIKNNSELKLTLGDQIRQYLYVNDVPYVIFDTISAGLTSGIFNISGVEEFSVKQLVKLLFDLSGKSIPESIFGHTKRVDSGMRILKLNGSKLKQFKIHTPATRISQVISRY